MNGFYEPEKNKKKTQKFDTRFREHDQSVEMNAQGRFPFFRSTKNSKMNFLIANTIYFHPCKTLKRLFVFPKYFQNDFYKLYKRVFLIKMI